VAGVAPTVARPGGISYLRIPAVDPGRSARFYAAVFGWEVDAARAQPSFTDGTGHVIGHFVADVPASEDAGIRPYVYVESVDAAVAAVEAQGGQIVEQPYPEGNLRVATFRDPAGNIVGLWQMASRQ
jgi:predicted enzyme related to lactoylglutathione lyase